MTIAVLCRAGRTHRRCAMLKAEGHELVGLTMQLWNQRRLRIRRDAEQVQGRCCSIDDVYDARRVAETLAIPYYVVNHQERFERDVIRPFVDEYLAGVHLFLQFVQKPFEVRPVASDCAADRAEQIATGHYARNEYDPQRGGGF